MASIAALLFVGLLLVTQVIQIARNESSIEGMLESDHIKKTFDKGSIWLNFKDFYGDNTSWPTIFFPLI